MASAGDRVYDRRFLLGDKRNEVLSLAEVQRYGRDSFGDPDYVSVYGLTPVQWYARGVRLLGRTAVECTRDRLAALIARDAAAVARGAAAATVMVADLFAGSGNTLHWLKRCTGARRAIGFELDDIVFTLARGNVSALGLGLDLVHDSYDHGLRALGEPGEDLVIAFVAPPWGDALREGSGLDLRHTRPPVAEVIDITTGALRGRRLLLAVQVYETVEPESLTQVTARFPWSGLTTYDIDAPGHNHGLLLASWGWTPEPAHGERYA